MDLAQAMIDGAQTDQLPVKLFKKLGILGKYKPLEKGQVRDVVTGKICTTKQMKLVRRDGYAHKDAICIED